MSPRHAVRFWLWAWPGCATLAIANAGLRDAVLVERLGDLHAHQLATVILVPVLGTYTVLLDRRRPLPSGAAALRVGTAWAGFTLLFEFGLGTVRGLPMSRMVADYDLAAGRVWILIPITMMIAPVLVQRRRRRRAETS
jgi:hypothetical protein